MNHSIANSNNPVVNALSQRELERFLEQHPDIQTVEVLLTDLNGVLRGKWLPIDNIQRLVDGNFKMPLSSVAPDVWGRDVPSLCQATGDGDGICQPIAGSLKTIPWLKRPTAQLRLRMTEDNGAAWGYDPRVVLETVYQRYRERGLNPVTAPELEFYLFLEQRTPLGAPELPCTRINGNSQIGGQIFNTDAMHEYADLLHDIREACSELGVPLDTIVKELSPGQFELNLHHVDNPLLAADNAQQLKRIIKSIAQQYGYIASFMAKPMADLDGNGLHIHASIIDDQGNNIFDDGSDKGSDHLRHALAGLQQTMSDTFLIFAPHMNSYRRFKAGSHAPVAPTWGYENRDVAMRIPNGDHRARRIEYRVAGADTNPYLAMAALLAGMLYGIDHKLEPTPAMATGYSEQKPTLPRTWIDALKAFEQSDYVKSELGQAFQDAYSAVKDFEQRQFEGNISAFEYDSYLILA
ncbi:MAG: glutamine synthetase family protein [Cellvibrionaceae bacterium]